MSRRIYIDPEGFWKLVDAGLSRTEIAERLGTSSVDHISKLKRTLKRGEVDDRKVSGKPLTEKARRRIVELTAEGMPSTWVAEDVGCHRDTIRRVMPFGKEAKREWAVVWQRIRQDENLLALHYQFAPKLKK